MPILTLLALIACKPDTVMDGECATGGTGTLAIELNDFDNAWLVDPGVDVYDADGVLVGTFGSDGETSLPSGVYTISTRRAIADADTFAGSALGRLTETVSPLCVPSSETVDFEYAGEPNPSSSRLWVAAGNTLSGYGGLSDPGASVEADAVLSFASAVTGAAWDRFGNLWVATGDSLSVIEPGDVEGVGDAAPLRELAGPSGIADLDVDAAGNLWVTHDGGIAIYSEAVLIGVLLGGGELTAVGEWTIGDTPSRTYFDQAGGFYVVDGDSVHHVPALTTVQGVGTLDTDASFTTTIDVGGTEVGLVGATDVVLDDTGLWVLYVGSELVAHVSRSANGTVRSSFTSEALAGAGGLVRDGSNGVWWLGEGAEVTLQRFLADDGMQDRTTTLTGRSGAFSLYFDPPVPLPQD